MALRLTTALSMIEDVTWYVNCSQGSDRRLFRVAELIYGFPGSLVQPSRRIVKVVLQHGSSTPATNAITNDC